MRRTLSIVSALVMLVAAPGARAGSAEVRFVEPEHYTDARDASLRREDALATLEKHFKDLAARMLPAQQVLHVEVLDVDLAGEARPRMRLNDVRVLHGSVDWPRIDLRYTLTEGDRVLASGTEQLADMAYMLHGLPELSEDGLPYERRMIEHWFAQRFAPGRR